MGGYIVQTAGNKEIKTFTFGKGDSSYDAETKSLQIAIEETTKEPQQGGILILTDCQSTLKSMEKKKKLTQDEYNMLKNAQSYVTKNTLNQITFQYVPGHSGIELNEQIDKAISFASKTQHHDIKVGDMIDTPFSHKATTKKIKKGLMKGEKDLLRRLRESSQTTKGNNHSFTAETMLELNIDRTTSKIWRQELKGNRRAQVILGKIISYGFFRRHGTQLTCQHCQLQLNPIHILIQCPKLNEQRKKASARNEIDYNYLSINDFRKNKKLLPTLIKESTDILEEMHKESMEKLNKLNLQTKENHDINKKQSQTPEPNTKPESQKKTANDEEKVQQKENKDE